MRKLVLDVSKWDTNIDFPAWMKKHGLWGVIIKAGGQENNLGRYKDSMFDIHYRNAKAAGLHIGAYYYSVAWNESTAKLDAQHFVNIIKNYEFDMPLYIDMEDSEQLAVGKNKLTNTAVAFMDIVAANGYKSGIYTGGNAWLYQFDNGRLLPYADWIAWWISHWPDQAGDIGMWQQGSMNYNTGKIALDDVSGNVDCNWCAIDYPAQIKQNPPKKETTKKTKIEPIVKPGPTADDVIRIAEQELGYYAPNDPEPGSKYGRWMAKKTGESWMAGPSSEIWWCCMFVSWVLDQAGVKVPGFPSQNTDLALGNGAKSKLVKRVQDIQRGDILIFDWNWATDATDHIGFAKASPSGSTLSTIEGNVGNAVQNKTRNLNTIRYVIRPDYGGSSVEQDIVNNNKNGGKLVVDGSAGYNTILDWQDQLGTPCDGEISGQDYSLWEYFAGVSKVTWEGSGSALVRAIQEKVGVDPDGIWGYDTSGGIQQYLVDHGYSVGNAGVDHYFGGDSVRGLQQSLNDGLWKK